MSKGLGCLAAVVVVVVILAVIAGGSYNRLVGLSQAVDAQWAQVESVYQRRADLIPNLVATVQGAANFEKSTLEAVTQARALGLLAPSPGRPENAGPRPRGPSGILQPASLAIASTYEVSTSLPRGIVGKYLSNPSLS